MKFRSVLLILALATFAHAGPVNKATITARQPDGATVQLRLMGDEFFFFAETLDGYTALRTAQGHWVYARIAADGSLEASDMLAHDAAGRQPVETAMLSSLRPHLRPRNTDLKAELVAEIQRRLTASPLLSRMAKRSDKTVWRIPVILVQFPDTAAVETKASFEDMFNQSGWDGGFGSHGSFNDYYEEVSYDQFGIQADIFGWYTADNPHHYYSWDHEDCWARAQQFALDAVNKADADVDFSQYDNDGDGAVDQVIIVHAGPGAAAYGNTVHIWPHKFNLRNAVTRDGITVYDYTLQEELQYGHHAGVGMYCHEFGHALGLPDLYDTNGDTNGNSQGIGNWGLMAAGAWGNGGKCPTHFCAWSKIQLGWLEPEVLALGTTVDEISLNSATAQARCVKLMSPNASNNEYFLLENRQQHLFDSYAPGHGLVIMHINDNMSNNNNATRKRVDVEEADGRNDLDHRSNRGDAGDPFPGSSATRSFDKNSFPNSKLTSGDFSGISLTNIQENGETITAALAIVEETNTSTISYVDIPDITCSSASSWTYFYVGASDDRPNNSFGCWHDGDAADGKLRLETYCKKVIGTALDVNSVTGQNGSTTAAITALEEGAEIGPESAWQTTGNADGTPDDVNDYYPNEAVFYHAGHMDWAGQTAYAGIQIVISGQVHYAWLRVSLNAMGSAYTLLDYAYNTVPGEAILAGQKENTGTPGNDEITGATLFAQNFEAETTGQLPTGWTQNGTTSTLKFVVAETQAAHDEDNGDWTCTPGQGDKALFIGENWVGSGPTTLKLTTPAINLTNAESPVLTFKEIRSWDNYYPSAKPEHSLNIMAQDAGGQWTKAATVNASETEFMDWQTRTVDLKGFAGQTISIAFELSSHHYFWGLDAVAVVDTSAVTSVSTGDARVRGFRLDDAYPNPFNPATTVGIHLPVAQRVTATAYDLRGRKVCTLHHGPLDAGRHLLRFDASNLPTGVYFIRVVTPDFTQVKKCLYLK